jgi:FkbM family methyltransferase
MYTLLKKIYFKIPFKVYFFRIIKKIYKPSINISGYLKFQGAFNLLINDGLTVKIYNDNLTVASLLFWQGMNGYEPQSLKIWNRLSEKSRCILDVGANIGIFGLISKRANPSAKVILFEPLERNVKRIHKNFMINGLDCIVEQVAVSNYEGKAVFYDMDTDENTIGSFDKNFVEGHKHSSKIIPIEIPVIKLDSYINDRNIEDVDLIKIDVEGVDFEVLMGLKHTIEQFKPIILIEISDTESSLKINNLLEGLSFKYLLYEVDENEGLIKRDKIFKDSNRNYLFSPLPTEQLLLS